MMPLAAFACICLSRLLVSLVVRVVLIVCVPLRVVLFACLLVAVLATQSTYSIVAAPPHLFMRWRHAPPANLVLPPPPSHVLCLVAVIGFNE